MRSTDLRVRPVHVVVVAYYQPEALRRCLLALAGSTQVTVIDNSSDLAVRDVVSGAGATYIDPGANLGFGAGVNVALRRILAGEPADVLLLNPDAVIEAQDIRSLATCLHRPENSRIGALSPALRGSDHRPQRVLWPFPTPWLAWREALGFGRFNRSTGFAIGAVLLLRWEALHDVGLFDERFFLYAEETDWQRRARDHGWSAAIAPDLVAEHIGGGTSSDERRRQTFFHSGGETYQRKWHGTVGWQVFRAAVLVGCLPRLLDHRHDKRRSAALRLTLYARGPRRAAGLED